MPVFGTAPGGRQSWRRRLKHFTGQQVRQVPCLHAIVHNVRCWKRQRYQVLGEDEEGNVLVADDRSQCANTVLGQCMVMLGMLCMVGITLLIYVTKEGEPTVTGTGAYNKNYYMDEFRQDSPIILYMGAIEILLCGACAHTAALMFKRRRHAIKHPAESNARERQCYIKVELEKDAGMEGSQLYGLGFRPSTDGMECLLVEAIRRGSILDQWNHPSLDDFVIDDGDIEVSLPSFELGQVMPGSAVVAVNDVTADIGMMQLQLTKPKVTMWVRLEVIHPSQLDTEILAAQTLDDMSAPEPPAAGSAGSAAGTDGAPPALPSPTVVGQRSRDAFPSRPAREAGLRCACIAFEDEEPQILTRWTVCSILGGWITLLPVLLMQPHDERPRQKLFRQHLLKPCCFILPVWIILWLLDIAEVLFRVEVLRPFYYFSIVHMLFPAVVVRYLLQMQAADEKLVLDQRRAREAEASSALPVAIEDPSPTLLKELIMVNPIALIFIGASAALPIVIFSLLTPLETERGRKAKGYVINMYGPLIVVQVMMAYFMYQVPFVLLPRVYLACVGLLLSPPCLLTCCCCLVCSSCYGRNDFMAVQQQRLDRAREAVEQRARPGEAAGAGGARGGHPDLVDCAVAQQREWELIYTA